MPNGLEAMKLGKLPKGLCSCFIDGLKSLLCLEQRSFAVADPMPIVAGAALHHVKPCTLIDGCSKRAALT